MGSSSRVYPLRLYTCRSSKNPLILGSKYDKVDTMYVLSGLHHLRKLIGKAPKKNQQQKQCPAPKNQTPKTNGEKTKILSAGKPTCFAHRSSLPMGRGSARSQGAVLAGQEPRDGGVQDRRFGTSKVRPCWIYSHVCRPHIDRWHVVPIQI